MQAIAVRGECGGQNLDRDDAIEARVACAVHLSHSADAQQLHDFIGAQMCARVERHDCPRLYPWKSFVRYFCACLSASPDAGKRAWGTACRALRRTGAVCAI